MWHVYILECGDGRFYTGMTNNIERRLKQHRSGRGGKFTKSFKVVGLLYQEEAASRADAMRRESEIKRYSREKKEMLVQKRTIRKLARTRKVGRIFKKGKV